jgi:tubulin-specific chaperone D
MALADYLDSISDENLISILKCLETILRVNQTQDRIVVPSIETIAGLLEEGIFSRIEEDYEYFLINSINLSFRIIFILTQKVGYKSGNVIKLLACVRMYFPSEIDF